MSLLPCRQHLYRDVHIYLENKPTRKGITIRSDLGPAVMEQMQQALRTSWDQMPTPQSGKALPQHWQTNVY